MTGALTIAGDPKSLEELLTIQQMNTKLEGNGILAIYVQAPCLFCGAPRFMNFRLLDIRQTITKKQTCYSCHRSAKAVRSGNAVYTWFQIDGPDAPAFVPIQRLQ